MGDPTEAIATSLEKIASELHVIRLALASIDKKMPESGGS
jgi:hypothetical protein